ncbi:MAG: hypothetical protein LBN08_07300 [Lactobacillales bacterium]|jgi:superoxide reductase|nr:hypothetical protein [Lactobacillales bacterium]
MIFMRCKHCGKFVAVYEDGGGVAVCCGEPMTILEANTSDGAGEKHVPDVKVDGNNVHVQIGSVMHPALPEHHIEWIVIVTNLGEVRHTIPVGDDPASDFVLSDGEKVVEVYEYCNIHGLWKV